MPIWLAGVVAGSRGRHSAIWCEPLRTQRDRVGRVPPFTPSSRTGNGTPSACTNTTPGTSASGRTVPLRRLALRIRPAVTASSVPAVTTHTAPVETSATIHAAAIADRKETPLTPGSQNVSQMMNACPKTASSSAPDPAEPGRERHQDRAQQGAPDRDGAAPRRRPAPTRPRRSRAAASRPAGGPGWPRRVPRRTDRGHRVSVATWTAGPGCSLACRVTIGPAHVRRWRSARELGRPRHARAQDRACWHA